MKWLAGALVIVVLLLQYRLLVSADGLGEMHRLEADVAAQRSENAALSARNARLAAEVRDLKQGLTALEERARSELGMVAPRESFYQVVPRPGSAAGADTRTRTAQR
ncbi:MAG: Cell division protein FtsB [Steroidobacteraceae bacterium]|nr:Cell division protein FtsB [Steroidobacteraceae bacterium]